MNDRSKVAAAEALGVNYRTMVTCHESRHVSRRMRKALAEFRDKHGDGGDEQDDEAGDIAEKIAALEERVTALEGAHGAMAETVEAQAKQLTELQRNVGGSEDGAEEEKREPSKPDPVGDGDGRRREWRPPRREHGLPDAGVVTSEEQPDEEHAFGAPVGVGDSHARRLRPDAAAGDRTVGRFAQGGPPG